MHLKATCWVSRRKKYKETIISRWSNAHRGLGKKKHVFLPLSPNTSCQPCCKASLCPTWYWTHPLHLLCYSPHSILSSHIKPCPIQELQAQGYLLSVCCTASFLLLWIAIISYSLPPLSFWTPLFSLVSNFSASHGSLLPIHQANSNSQPWQCPQTNYLIKILRSTPNHFRRAVCCSFPLPTHVQ